MFCGKITEGAHERCFVLFTLLREWERNFWVTGQENYIKRIKEFSVRRNDRFPSSDILFQDAQSLYSGERTGRTLT